MLGTGSPTVVLDAGSGDAGISNFQRTPLLRGSPAGRYPDEVAGLVLLDVPAGQANFTTADVGGPWNGPGNPEHMDYVAVERQMALHRLPIPRIPVTVVTASGGQSADPDEQRVWLKGSSRPRQVVLGGGHEIHEDDPDGVHAEVERVLWRAFARAANLA